MKKTFALLTFFSLILGLFSGCGSTPSPEKEAVKPNPVRVQTVAESRVATHSVGYPAAVIAEDEATVVAKASGTVSEVRFALGDEISSGQILVKIDDTTANPLKTAYENAINALQNAGRTSGNQVDIASLAIAQAKTSLDQARQNYTNLQASTAQDLKQAEISKEQAEKNVQNTSVTTIQAQKSAELAYNNSKLMTEQARLNLENRRVAIAQSSADLTQNTEITMKADADTAETIIQAVNTMTGFFDPDHLIVIDYPLGALDYKTYTTAREHFLQAWNLITTYHKTVFPTLSAQIDATLALLEETKITLDAVKALFDKTPPTGNLPLDAAPGSGKSLNAFRATISTYQSQINTLLAQGHVSAQAYTNLNITNKTALDSLEKAYEISQQQEDISRQNLENVRAGNTSQNDQTTFGAASASTQLESLKIKLSNQLSAAKAQIDSAEIQYENTLKAAENARAGQSTQVDAAQGQADLAKIQIDNLSPAAPISGKITQKLVGVGDTVTVGQPLATISQPGVLKLQFYADADFVPLLNKGQEVTISTNSGQSLRGAISNISPTADTVTKRFLVEALPEINAEIQLTAGTVVSIQLQIMEHPQNPSDILLPLSALTIAPSESYLYTVKDGKAEKTIITVVKVQGETAEVKMTSESDTQIIVEGNKLLNSGDGVEILTAPETSSQVANPTNSLN